MVPEVSYDDQPVIRAEDLPRPEEQERKGCPWFLRTKGQNSLHKGRKRMDKSRESCGTVLY